MDSVRRNKAFLVIITAIALILSVAGCLERKSAHEELMSYFPDKTGFTWVYSGFAEYGHRMILDSITEVRSKGDVVYQISGMVEDMSGGESEEDFSFQVQYIFGETRAVERILHKGIVFPHRIDGLVMLEAPINEGHEWSFTAEDGSKVDAEITETGVDDEDNLAYCEVEYTTPDPDMPDGLYRESRVFKKGIGVASFASTIMPEVEFSYSLMSVSSPE